MSDYETSDDETNFSTVSDGSDEDSNFNSTTKGYLYEPEYTDAELEQMDKEREEREREDREVVQSDAGPTTAVARGRMNDKWWCTCSNCEVMPTEVESYCCHEWELIMPQMQNLSIDEDANAPSVCITSNDVFPAMLNAGVLETFFYIPKINWKKRPKPAGLDGQMSAEQYRLVAYRMVTEWALKGEKLGKGYRRVLPSCVVNLIRTKYPSPNGQYQGFKESEEAHLLF
ncbi:P2X purinoceptor 7-like [Siphateles boraxobius]|uniref:P2X purinoceptor 7-like n=1 Tax=Siphateles boraxobius TaxID=180520 RepID=UPI004063E0BC